MGEVLKLLYEVEAEAGGSTPEEQVENLVRQYRKIHERFEADMLALRERIPKSVEELNMLDVRRFVGLLGRCLVLSNGPKGSKKGPQKGENSTPNRPKMYPGDSKIDPGGSKIYPK